MNSVIYNQQTARAVYILSVLTGTDLMVIMGLFSLNMVTLEEPAINIALFFLYPVYLASFRVGRNPGYDWHLFSSLFYAKHKRPGRREFRYPVITDQS